MFRRYFFHSLAVLLLCLGPAARTQAVPVTGVVNITGSLSITSLTLDFLLPVGPPNGVFLVGFGTTGDFSGLPGTSGAIRDISNAPGTAQPTFLTFAASPTLRFDLTSLSAGVFGSAQCGAPAAPGQTCTPPGSIFNFVNTTATSSSASFSVIGNFSNVSGELTPYTGIFTVQFPTQSYQQLLATLAGGGSIQTTYSASFGPTTPPGPIPEPATMLLLGSGLVGIAAKVRKRRKSV